MAKVSIIIPIYNVESYLRECMDSVVRQTMKEIEIICVNDGSTDGSREVLRAYEADPRVRILDRKNGGYGRAMNAGLDAATGEYIGIVEPDDYIALNMYEDLYQTATKNDLDLVKADFLRFETDTARETRQYQYIHLSIHPEDYGRVFRPLDQLDSFRFVMNTWAGIYRTSFLREHDIRHQETPGASFQDNGFWFQTFLYAERAMILDQPMYRLRRDNPNSSTKSRQKIYAMNVEYDYIRGILWRDPAIWERCKGVYWMKRFQNQTVTLCRIDPSCRAEYRRQAARELKWGYARGEFSEADFLPEEWIMVQDLMAERPLAIETPPLTELELIQRSRSYRIGQAITWLPRKLRHGAGRPE